MVALSPTHMDCPIDTGPYAALVEGLMHDLGRHTGVGNATWADDVHCDLVSRELLPTSAPRSSRSEIDRYAIVSLTPDFRTLPCAAASLSARYFEAAIFRAGANTFFPLTMP